MDTVQYHTSVGSPSIQATSKGLSLTVSTPLGEDVLIMDRLRAIEQVSTPFYFIFEMHSKKNDLDFEALVGKVVTATYKYGDKKRHFSGIVGEIEQGQTYKDKDIHKTRYTAKVYPKFWLLKFSQDHQIFQNKSAMDIIKAVLGENGVSEMDPKAGKCGKAEREYCVQYRESYFDFVSRLMEEEGIYYYFEHSAGSSKLVIDDDSSGAESAYDSLPMTLSGPMSQPYLDQIQTLNYSEQVVSKGFSAADYNFKTASTKLLSKADGKGEGLKVYRFPGGFPDSGTGDGLATNRIQELEWRKKMIRGESSAPMLCPMYSFKVKDHPRKSVNEKYIVYRVVHEITNVPEGGETLYRNEYEAFPESVPFRSPIVTPKPFIASTQTAKVTGKSGEEIFCDEYGRIKVHFYWDQKGSEDEKSSCWIRVAQLWAASGWGGLWTPRIGMEVVVTFLEGDPDRPLITGCVYNSDNMPPYAKAEPTKSTIRSNTTKGGGGNNEIRFEDKKDKEEIFIHAQKDMNTVVEDNRTLKINDEDDTTDIMCGDRTVTLHAEEGKKKKDGGNDKLTLTKGSRTVLLSAEGKEKAVHTLTIKKGDNIIELNKGDMKTTLDKGDMTTTLTDGHKKITLDKGDMTTTLTKGDMKTTLDSGDQTIDITGKRTISVSKDETHKNTANFTHTVIEDYTLTVTGKLTIEVTGAISIEGDDKITITAKDDLELKSSSGKVTITADQDAEFKSSSGKMTISSDGDAEFKSSSGKMTVQSDQDGTYKSSSGKVTVKACGGDATFKSSSGDAVIKGNNVKLN